MPTVDVTMWDAGKPCQGPDPTRLPPLGAWVQQAACGELDDQDRATFTAEDRPDSDTLGRLVAVCELCPVAQECGDQADQERVRVGLWAGVWRGPRRQVRKVPTAA